jgi:hypothetical protein
VRLVVRIRGRPSGSAWDTTVGLSVGLLGATALVLVSGGVDVAFSFVVAGGASVAAVVAGSVSPAVAEADRSEGSAVGDGAVGAAGGASIEGGMLHRLAAGEGGGKGLDLLSHLGDFGSGIGGSGYWGWLLRDVVGAMVSGRARGFDEFSVPVPFFEVGSEMGEGFGIGGGIAPFSAGSVEKTCFENDVVAETNHLRSIWFIAAIGGKFSASTELFEEILNGCWRMPCSGHSDGVLIKLFRCNFAVGAAEVVEEVETGSLAKSEDWVFSSLKENCGGGGDELVAESFVDVVIQLEFVEELFVEADGFGDLGASGTGRV